MTILDFNSAKRLDQIEAEKRTVDADSIRARLHADAEGFVRWLYSGRALVKGEEARIGDVYGTPGASLSIALKGTDAGLWRDHATGEGGDLIGLYMAYMGYEKGRNFVLALKEIAAEFLGDAVQVERPAWGQSAAKRIEEKRHKLGDKPRQDHLELGPPVCTWKYYDLAGNIIASVVRYEPDGTPASKTYRPYCYKKIEGREKWMMGAPDLRPLYRLPQIALAPVVVLVEGEKCAEALASIGIEATTAMQGAEAPIDRTDWTPLAGKTVRIWPDNDPPGLEYARKVAARLMSMGCTIRGVEIPAGKAAKWDAADCIAEGSDPRALIDAATPWEREQRKSRIRLVSLREMETMPPPAWLIDGVIVVGGLSMIWGRSGSMKSFAALDKALCIATGMDWHGRKVRKGRVIYLAAEGAFGLAQRAIGWWKNRGKDYADPDILLVPHGLTLTSDDLAELIQAIKEAGDMPVFLVIDTMSRTFGNGNPNQPADMNQYVAAADRLREATGAHVMVVHHAGEDEDRNEIGNKGLRNACDTVIFVKRTKDRIQLINEAPKGKQKDAEEFPTIKLRSQKVSYTTGPHERSTLVLMPDEEPAAADGGTTRDSDSEAGEVDETKLGKVQKAVLKTLRSAKISLGLLRICSATGSDKGTVHTALARLVDYELVQKVRSECGTRDEWIAI